MLYRFPTKQVEKIIHCTRIHTDLIGSYTSLRLLHQKVTSKECPLLHTTPRVIL